MPKSKPDTNAARTGQGRDAPARPRSATRIAVVSVVALVGLALLVGAFLMLTRDADDGAAVDTAAAMEVAHVHGLGVDPHDDVLYAGTHYGVFRMPEDGDAARIAGRVQDFMGFTVVGPQHYLASGHPGEGQDGPTSLGLIESTDGGQTWQSLSLAGEADFHALEARHGLVYGFNSLTGRFLVSEDKQTWDVRSEIPMADFAVSPEDPAVLLATTQEGLVRSDDGGRTFSLVAGAPLLQLVSWMEAGTVVGVAPDGTVHASTDGGQGWAQRGSLGDSPHALATAGDSDVFAAVDGAILASTDGGSTFVPRHEE